MNIQHPTHPRTVLFKGTKAKTKKPESLMQQLAQYKAPLAAASMLSMIAPGLANAAITPDSQRLVKATETTDDNLLEASLVQLGMVNETDALPTVKKVLGDGKVSVDALKAAAKAAGLLGAKSSDADKAELSGLLMPYLQKVVFQDKDKNNNFVDFRQAVGMFREDPKNSKVKDIGFQAARALGEVNHQPTLSRLAKAAQDVTVSNDVRMFALEAIKAAPAEPGIDGQLVEFFDKLDAKADSKYVNKLVEIFIKHNVKSGWDKLDKLINPAPASATGPSDLDNKKPTPAAPKETNDIFSERMVASASENLRVGLKDEDEDTGLFFMMFRREVPLKETVINEILKTKKLDSADFVLKEIKKDPGLFLKLLGPTYKYFRATGPDMQKKFVEWVDSAKAEAAVLSENPASPYSSDKAADAKALTQKTQDMRVFSIIMSALLHQKDAFPEFQKLYANNLENPGLRHLGVAATAYVKDAGAANALLTIATDDKEDVDTRYDALMAVMDVTTPPLAKDLQSNNKRIEFFQKYTQTFLNSDKLTHSFYKAEMFNEIRDARKVLIKANAPLQQVDEITKKILDKRLADVHSVSELRAELLKTPSFQQHAAKMVNYISKANNADGYLRVLMIEALGQAKNTDVKDALKELVNDPLARTKIGDVQSSNDMFMFPGYTKQEVANMTRLAAVQALGSTGSLGDADVLEKGLRSDDRRLHMISVKGLGELGKNVFRPEADLGPAHFQKMSDLVDRMIQRMSKVQLHGSPRLNNYFQKMYAGAIANLGGADKLLDLMDKTDNTVLKRAIANGLINDGKYMGTPQVAQYLLSTSLGLEELHKKGIDGRGTEVAIIDGDYINDDIDGLQGKIVYPEWGNTKDAALRESFHGESVASVMAGKKANIAYGIAPGVDKIYSYAAWDDNQDADRNTPIEEADGMLRSIDDIVTKKIAGKTKVSVVNMSLGGSAAMLYADEVGAKKYLDKLAARFEAGSKAGITFVISAGNEGGDSMRHHLVGTLNVLGFNKQNGKLVQSKGVILVGASDTQGTQNRDKHTISWFSSVGDVFNNTQPDVVAPGTNIPLVNREANGVINMDEMDGTSFSAPITTGIALLINQAAGKPVETEKLREILSKTAYQLQDTPNFQQGAGGIDATKAVDEAKKERVSASFNTFLESVTAYLGNGKTDPEKVPTAIAAPPQAQPAK